MTQHSPNNVRIMRLHDIISLSLPIADVILNTPKIRNAILAGRFLIEDSFKTAGIDDADFKLEFQDGRVEINVHDKTRQIPFDFKRNADIERYATFETAARGNHGTTAVYPSLAIKAIHQEAGHFQIVEISHPHLTLNPRDRDMPIIMMQAINHTVSTILHHHGLSDEGIDAVALMDIDDEQAFIDAVIDTMDEETLALLSPRRRNGIKLVHERALPGEGGDTVIAFPSGGRQIDS